MPPDPTRTALIARLGKCAAWLKRQHDWLWPASDESELAVHMRDCEEDHNGCHVVQAVEAMREAAALLAGEGQTPEKNEDLGLLGNTAGGNS